MIGGVPSFAQKTIRRQRYSKIHSGTLRQEAFKMPIQNDFPTTVHSMSDTSAKWIG
jgi:hypothetical protein